MADVTMRIEFVGDDPAQLAAFNRSLERDRADAELNSQHVRPEPANRPLREAPEAPLPSEAPPAARRVEPPPVPPPAPADAARPQPPEPPADKYANNKTLGEVWEEMHGPQDRVFASVESLTKKIEELITLELVNRVKAQTPEEKTPEAPSTSLGRLMQRVERFAASVESSVNKGMGAIGRTRVGKAISSGMATVRKVSSKAARTVAKTTVGRAASRGAGAAAAAAKRAGTKIAGSRAGQAVAGALGRTAATTAATGATGAATGAAAGGATAAAAALGPVGIAAAGVTVALAGTALTVKMFSDAVHRAADSLEDLSPEIAKVRGLQDARREMARLDRAGRTGAGVAQMEAARGRLAESTYELQTKLLEVVLKFAPAIEGILDAVNAGLRGVDLIVASLNVLGTRIDDFTNPALDNNKAADDAMDKAVRAFSQALTDVFQTNDPQQLNGRDPWLADLLRMGAGGGAGAAPQMPPNQGNFP